MKNYIKIKRGNFMEWFINNCWWIILIILTIVAGLGVALFFMYRKDKQIKKDFQEKILIVDDSELALKSLLKKLNALGLSNIETANSGELALDMFSYRVRKYIGAGEAIPKLNKLGTKEWENTKAKVKKNY